MLRAASPETVPESNLRGDTDCATRGAAVSATAETESSNFTWNFAVLRVVIVPNPFQAWFLPSSGRSGTLIQVAIKRRGNCQLTAGLMVSGALLLRGRLARGAFRRRRAS